MRERRGYSAWERVEDLYSGLGKNGSRVVEQLHHSVSLKTSYIILIHLINMAGFYGTVDLTSTCRLSMHSAKRVVPFF